MSAVYRLQREKKALLRHIADFVATLKNRVAGAARLLPASIRDPRPWYTLDERLLRDIGMTVVDAEIARLKSRMGAAEIQCGIRVNDEKNE
jgi:hypothetical protein